jgi:predicted metallopeptidase
MINYEPAEDIRIRVHDIVSTLGLSHVDTNRVVCMRSRGSSSRYTLARCHVLPRVFQKALGVRTHYIIEVVSEKFDAMSQEEQTKVLIHEVLHIPKSFGGGFKHHDFVNRRVVDKFYEKYKSGKQNIYRVWP